MCISLGAIVILYGSDRFRLATHATSFWAGNDTVSGGLRHPAQQCTLVNRCQKGWSFEEIWV